MPSGEPCRQNPPESPGIVLRQQKLEVSPESGVQWSCQLHRARAFYLGFNAGRATGGETTAAHTVKVYVFKIWLNRYVHRDMMKVID